jgi:hypothetical protein
MIGLVDRGNFTANPFIQQSSNPLIHSQKPVNESELSEHDKQEEHPNEPLAQSQSPLPGGREPELKFGRADGDNVATAEKRGFGRFTVHHDQRILLRDEFKTFPAAKFKDQMLIPNTVVRQLQIIFTGATDAERKTADNRLAARQFSCQNVKFNH